MPAQIRDAQVDDDGIRVVGEDGRATAIRWDELETIQVRAGRPSEIELVSKAGEFEVARQVREAQIDEHGVSVVADDGRRISVEWDELGPIEVGARRRVDVPPEVEFRFRATDRECVLPLDQAPADLVTRLQELSGFDNAALLESLSVADGAEPVCWRAPNGRSRRRGAPFPRRS